MAASDSRLTVQSPFHRLFSSRTDSHIAHLNRILSTASGVDSTLLLVGYILTLVHSQLSRLLDLNLRVLAARFASNASKTLLPGETVIATLPAPVVMSRIASMTHMTKTLAGLCSEVRAFMRLWGLLGIWAWAKSTYYDGSKDRVLRAVAWGQIIVNTTYLVFEHPAYLAGKGVLRGWSPEKQAQWYRWSGRSFAGHIALDYVRLWRVRQLRQKQERSGQEKEDKIEMRTEEDMWWKEFYVCVFYTPLVLHWSLADGFVNDVWYGLLGTGAGLLGFREVWRQTL